MRSIYLFWLLGSVVLGGASAACAVKQPPPPADTLAGILPGTTAVAPDWRAAAPGAGDGVVIVDWVRTFQDAQLDALVEEGLRHNLDLTAAAARVDMAG